MTDPLEIHPDIRKAMTLPASVYTDARIFELQRETVFARSWQFVAQTSQISENGFLFPWTFLPGSVEEPLLLARDEKGGFKCLSNVCTHRGNILVEKPCKAQKIRCAYHGRRFGFDGRMEFMPEFAGVENFPVQSDDLPLLQLREWNGLLFVALDPMFSFEEWIAPVQARVGWLPVTRYALDADGARDYPVHANWALYCDNYLEAFHIPYVHPGLTRVLDYSGYTTEVFRYCNLQLAVGAAEEPSFDLPGGHPDFGKKIAAFYFWMFPNLMLNFYPWGLSVNVVKPFAADRTIVSFVPYVGRSDLRGAGAGGDLNQVEMEDEAVVHSVQRGVRSRLYERGRYSPTQEIGTHHFHRLLVEFMEKS